MGRINQYPKASAINGNDTLLGVVGGTTKQVAKDVLLSGVTNDISNTTIVGKKTGKVVTADDSSKNRLPEITAYGKSVQNGEPTPDKSVDIVSVDKTLTVKSCSKNLLPNISTSTTHNGITFTVNEDGSVTVNGTASADADLKYHSYGSTDVILNKGTYIFSGLGENTIKAQFIFGYGRKQYGNVLTKDTELNVTTDIAWFMIRIKSGTVCNNLTLYPMIRSANITDATYEPYISTQASITLADDLRGIPVTEGGNYTDANGQQWICDTVEKYADGTGMWTKRVYRKVFDGTESFDIFNNNGIYFVYADNKIKRNWYGTLTNSLCSRLKECRPESLISNANGFSVNKGSNGIAIKLTSLTNVTDVASLKSQLKAWYDAGEPLEFICELAEYIETDLTAEELAELENLQTFEPCTTVMTDDIGEIAITYFKNSDSGKIVGSLNDRISNLVALLQSNGVI